jgi:hypothetical protein
MKTHRVTHPKQAQDFEFSDSEIKLLNKVDAWFWRLYQEILKVLDRPEFFTPKKER